MMVNTELAIAFTGEHRVIETYGDAIWEAICNHFPTDQPFKTSEATKIIYKRFGWARSTAHRYTYVVLRNVASQGNGICRLGASRWLFPPSPTGNTPLKLSVPDHTTSEGREALSLRYGSTVIPILRLSNGHFAIFNHAYELCGIVDDLTEWPPICWFPAHRQQAEVDLHDLGLL